MTKINLIAVAVLSAMASGYRRAGFALEQGENKLEVTPEQLENLKGDKRLTVAVNLEPSKSVVFANTTTSADLSVLVAAITALDKDDETLWTNSGKPKTEALPNGTDAKQRDAAWDVVLSELDSTKAE